jgi:DNA-binding transcriptional LysR family regulator
MSHLRYFVAVAEELNFTRAAARLHMATSPLSRRIKDLERELGAPLFHRSHHRVELTAAGEALLPLARDVVARFDAVPRRFRELVGPPRRAAVIGIAPDVPPALRDRLLAAAAERRPELDVRLHPASSEPLLRGLLEGALDMALVHGPVGGRGIRSVPVHAAPVRVVVGRGVGFDGRTEVRLDELAHLPFAFVGPDGAPELYRMIDELLNRAGVRKRTIVEGRNYGAVAQLVAVGQAFTLAGVGSGATAKAFTGEPVLMLTADGGLPALTTVAAWPTDRADPGRALAELAAEVARDLPG